MAMNASSTGTRCISPNTAAPSTAPTRTTIGRVRGADSDAVDRAVPVDSAVVVTGVESSLSPRRHDDGSRGPDWTESTEEDGVADDYDEPDPDIQRMFDGDATA
jgi:hypothetical protein